MNNSSETISIVIPVYNEKDSLLSLSDAIAKAMENQPWSFEVVWVNDGSTDGSDEILDRIASGTSHSKVIHFRRNFGQTAAMMAGIDHSEGNIIVAIDADFQNDPNDIPLLVHKLYQGYDVCSGWRKERKDRAVTRVFPSRVANLLISWISGVHLNDYGCTLKAYRREVIEDVRLYGEMHRFIPIYASWSGAIVTEIPVRHHPRKHGQSNYGMERIFKVILDLIVVKFLSDYSQKPIYIFGGFGLFSMLLSVLGFGAMLYYKFWGGKTFIETPLPSLVIMLFLMGFISVLMGLLAELTIRTYFESQSLRTYKVERILKVKPADKTDD